MSTNPSVSHFQLNLPHFDGFPYLLTRLVRGLYDGVPVPARQCADRYREQLVRWGGSESKCWSMLSQIPQQVYHAGASTEIEHG